MLIHDTRFFSSTGAVAQLYDISCLHKSSPKLFATIQEPIYEAWIKMSDDVTVQEVTAIIPALLAPEVILADHYFIPNPAGTGIAPLWDFRTSKRFHEKEDAFFVGAGLASVEAPTDPSDNINWLRINSIAGGFGDEVYRIDTVGGQPPTSVSILLL